MARSMSACFHTHDVRTPDGSVGRKIQFPSRSPTKSGKYVSDILFRWARTRRPTRGVATLSLTAAPPVTATRAEVTRHALPTRGRPTGPEFPDRPPGRGKRPAPA